LELEFSEEQEELQRGARAMLTRECPMSFVRSVAEDGAPWDGLWQQIVELGWPALTVPEGAGGLGLGTVELAVVVEELGRVMAPGPFLTTAAQFVPVVRQLGTPEQQDRFLLPIATGSRTGTLALAEPSCSALAPGVVGATATRDGDVYVLDGEKRPVIEADRADDIVVVARIAGTSGEDGVAAFVVPRDDLTLTPITSADATRRIAAVALDGTHVAADRLLGEPGPPTVRGLRRAIEEAVTALATEMVGTCQTIFDVTLDYAKQREQFGVPIGSFQAIKHKFSDMLILLEKARASAYFAALTIAEDDERRALAAASAKVAAGDCTQRMEKEGIQIHGGIGFTWEHDMHIFFKRAKSSEVTFGDATWNREIVARLIDL